MSISPESLKARWNVTSHEGLATPYTEYGDARSQRVAVSGRLAQQRACATLSDLFPTAHILIVTRSHEAIVQAMYSEMILGGGTFSFQAFCNTLLQRVVDDSDAFNFQAVIRDYSAAFGPEKVLVIPYETLRDDPTAFLGRIESFMGIGHHVFPTDRIHPTPGQGQIAATLKMTRWVHAIPGSADFRRRLSRRYIEALQKGRFRRIASIIARLGGQRGEDRTIPPKLLEAFAARENKSGNAQPI